MKRKALLFWTCSLLGAALVLFFLSPALYRLGAFRFAVRVLPGLGRTRIELPPVGAVEARTHLTPLDVVLTLRSVDLDQLQRLLGSPGARTAALATLREGGRRIAAHFLLRTLLLAAAGGAWGASWVRRSWPDRGKGAVLSAAVWVLVATGTAATFNVQAFQNPSYSGILKGAPWMLGLAQTAWERLDKLGADVRFLTQNLRQALDRANAAAPLERLQDDIKVLHVSDLHNNPLGLSFIAKIKADFGPDFIVDTGDLTDFGTPLEEGLLARLPALKVPYYVALGNHDSPVIAEEVRTLSGVHLLEGWQAVKGLTLAGRADPTSLSADIKPAGEEAVLAQVTDLSALIQEKGQAPFILAVHDPRVGENFAGVVPVILVGHTHQARVEVKGGSVLVNAGTTGGAGVRGVQSEKEVPLTAALLYVHAQGAAPQLDAVDIIRLYPRAGRFELARTTVGATLRQ